MGFLSTLGYGDAGGQGDSILSNLVRMRHLDQQERTAQMQEAYRNAMMQGAIAKQQREQAVGQILSRIPTETVETQMPVYDSPMAIADEPTQIRTPMAPHEQLSEVARRVMPIDPNVGLHFQARADAEKEKQMVRLADMWKYKHTAAMNAGDQNAVRGLEEAARSNPYLRELVSDVPIELGEAKAEKPTVHSFLEGGMHVDKQWNPKTNTWDVLSTAPRYKPEGDSSGKDARREELKDARDRVKAQRALTNRYNIEVVGAKSRYITNIRNAMPEEQAKQIWSDELRDIYTRHEPQMAELNMSWPEKKGEKVSAPSSSTPSVPKSLPSLPKGWKWETEGKVAIDDKGKRKQWVE